MQAGRERNEKRRLCTRAMLHRRKHHFLFSLKVQSEIARKKTSLMHVIYL
jgi:hypothetical protein